MNIYVISEHSSMSTHDVAYTTSKKKVDEYLSLTTGREAFLETSVTSKEFWNEDNTKENLFKNHRENVHYKGNNNLYWYSFRIEKGL